jgi:hypothetical protein
MENNAMCSDNLNDREAKVELELNNALLFAEGVYCHWEGDKPLAKDAITVTEDPHAKIAYPWSLLDPNSETFFAEAEEFSLFENCQETEIAKRSSDFFAGLHHRWEALSLQETLIQKFAMRVPQELVTAIAQRAEQVVSASVSLSDKLVESVQDVLPWLTRWTLEDLELQARPFAYAMRDGNTKVDSNVRTADWQELSDVDKAKLSLSVASYALTELNKQKQS